MWSVITCSANDARFAAVQANLQKVLAGETVEIICISDARSIAEGYTRGIAQSRGEVVILCHDDIEIFDANLPAKLNRGLKHADVLGIAGTTRLAGAKWVSGGPPHVYGEVIHLSRKPGKFDMIVWSAPAPLVQGMQALDGVFLCVKRPVLEAIPFDAQTFDGFHLYDIDFTFAAYQKGFKLAVCCDIPMLHRSYGDWGGDWNRYSERFRAKYRGKLAPFRKPDGCSMLCRLNSIEEGLEFFDPPHFHAPKFHTPGALQ